MLVLLWSMQCLVVCMLTIEVCQQFFCTFCVVRGQVVLHLLLLVCSVQIPGVFTELQLFIPDSSIMLSM